jgi:hypothetical protein
MATSGTVQLNRLRQTASCPNIIPLTWTSTVLPPPDRPDRDVQGGNPSGSTEEQVASGLRSTSKVSPFETPPGDGEVKKSAKSYDYLEVVEQLADRIDRDLYHDYVGAHLIQRYGDISYFDGSMVQTRPWVSQITPASVEDLLQQSSLASERGPCALILHHINKEQLETLGTLLNIDPWFFATHLTAYHGKDAKLDTLSSSYKSFVDSRQGKHRGLPKGKDPVAATSAHSVQVQGSWFSHMEKRWTPTRISCGRVSNNFCRTSSLQTILLILER